MEVKPKPQGSINYVVKASEDEVLHTKDIHFTVLTNQKHSGSDTWDDSQIAANKHVLTIFHSLFVPKFNGTMSIMCPNDVMIHFFSCMFLR